MEKLIKLVANLNKININTICEKLFNTKKVHDYLIIKEKNRLSQRGEDTKGTKIRTYYARTPNSYTNYTIIKKSENSGIAATTKHVTLYETGSFYKSFALVVKNIYAELTGSKSSISLLAVNLDTTNILGLTDSELSEFEDYLKPLILIEIKECVKK